MKALPMDNQARRKDIDQYTATSKAEMLAGSWWHSIDLGDGYVTRGVHTAEELNENFRRFNLAADLSGQRLLDIGCWDGFYSFEAERRGAEVFAIDCWTPENFLKAKQALDSRVEFEELSVHEISRERVGAFDIVLFLGVLYHLKHPLLALEQICEVTRNFAIVETHVLDDFVELPRPVMEFYELDELGGQYDNWWGPNVECLLRMLRTAGFAHCEVLRREPTRAVVKAYRSWTDPPVEAPRSLRIVNVINGVTYTEYFPHRGRRALLALSVTGLPADVQLRDVRVEVGGFGINPVYVGKWGGDAPADEWQINTPVSPGLDPGAAVVRVWHQGARSNDFEIRLSASSQW